MSTGATLVDVNGDGNLDAVSAGDTALKLSLGNGDGTFQPPQPLTTVDNFGDALYAEGRVISGDFNGDGKQDLLATGNVAVYTTQNYILFGHGDGTFGPPAPINISLGKVADLNNDGRSDVISIQNNAVANTSRDRQCSRFQHFARRWYLHHHLNRFAHRSFERLHTAVGRPGSCRLSPLWTS